MIVLDTTVLVYALGVEHPFRAPSRRLIETIGRGQLSATTTAEVIQEFVHVRARRCGRAEAAAAAEEYLALLSPLLTVGQQHVAGGLSLWRQHERLGSFDAVLAAAAMESGSILVSADQGFALIDELNHVTPDQPGVDRLLR